MPDHMAAHSGMEETGDGSTHIHPASVSSKLGLDAFDRHMKFPRNLEDQEYSHYITFHFMVDLTNKGASPLEAKIGYGFETPNTFTDSRAATAPGGGSLSSGIQGIGAVVEAVHGPDGGGGAVKKGSGSWMARTLKKLGVDRPRIVRSTKSISMYIPENIGTKYEHAYTDHRPGGLLTTVLGSGAGDDDLDKVLSAMGAMSLNDFSGGVTNIIKSVTGSNTAKALGIAAAIGTQGAFGGLGAYPSAIVRKTFNPRMEFLYKSTGTRTFEYSFRMIPKSVTDSKTIREIVRLFKVHSHPRIEDQNGNFLHFPNQFEIEYISFGGENKYLNKISTCVLTNMNVNYNTENRMQFMRNEGRGESPPMTTTIVLSFKELEILTAQRAEQGY